MAEGVEDLVWESALVENATRARLAVGLSQTELARRMAAWGLPFHQQTVQRIEESRRPIHLNEALVLCKVLRIDFTQAISPSTADERDRARLSELRSEITDIEKRLLARTTYTPVAQPVTQSRAVLNINEASERTGVPVNTLRYWRSLGDQGPKSFTIGRKVAYKADDIAHWLEEQYAK